MQANFSFSVENLGDAGLTVYYFSSVREKIVREVLEQLGGYGEPMTQEGFEHALMVARELVDDIKR